MLMARFLIMTLLAGVAVILPWSQTLAQRPAGTPASADVRVALISPHDAAKAIARPNAPLVVDVRDKAEFDVGHLPKAVRLTIDVDNQPRLAISSIARRSRTRTVIMYCTSMGRSAHIAERLHLDLLEAGVQQLLVLKGGIIEWANEGLPMVDSANKPTVFVHPHDPETAKLLSDQTRVHYGEKR